MDEPLTVLVRAVQASTKYRYISADLVSRLGTQELAVRRTLKEAIKETKNTLHQIYGAYAPVQPRYSAWLADLHAAVQADSLPDPLAGTALRAACLRVLAQHASTAERVPYMQTLYHTVLREVPAPRSVLDIGCGLNPLTLPWMGLPAAATYRCSDIDEAAIRFLSAFFALAGVQGYATVCDAVTTVPRLRVDLVLLLKVLPVLETQRYDAGAALLRALDAPWVVVSFPARTLGGRERGMVQHYEQQFMALVQAEGWPVRRFEFPTELLFLVHKPERCAPPPE